MDLDFNTLVNDAYIILDQQARGQDLILPEIIAESSPTRLHWKNVKEYLKVIRRHPDHFIEWMSSELPGQEINWFSGSKSDGLIVHGKRQKKSDLADLALKYVNVFVVCPSCKCADTKMTKTTHKTHEFECFSCGMKKFIV
jgi:translation initiation factor 2 beta subunit (eIF-2beta)/eIF-5